MGFDPADYPSDWKDVSRAIRDRSRGRCECRRECGVNHAEENALQIARSDVPVPPLEQDVGRCGRWNGDALGGYRVVLTVAHLWRGPCAEHAAARVKCGDPDHLKAMCQRCHLAYDREHHVAAARRTRHARKASGDLFDPPASSA